MKFNKILSLCKKLNKVILITDENSKMQHLSDGYGMYPMLGIPFCTIDNVKNLLGLSDKQRDTWIFKELTEVDEMYTLDTYRYEERLEPYFFSLKTAYAEIFIYKSSIGLIPIDKSHIDAISCTGDVEMYLRANGNNKVVLVKSGLINYGAIHPLSLSVEEISQIEDAFSQLQLAVQNS